MQLEPTRRGRSEGGVPRICLEVGCEIELEPQQPKFCGGRHAAKFRQRRHRQRLLEERALSSPVADVVFRVVDVDDFSVLQDEVCARLLAREGTGLEPDTYQGIPTISIVKEIFREGERFVRPQHVLPRSLRA